MRAVAIAAASILGFLSAPAFSQGYDPGASRAENQVNSINRSMTTQQENRASAAQNQFETNALRGQISRPAPPPITPPPATGPIVR